MTTATEIAHWMREQLRSRRQLYQFLVAAESERRFGSEFVYINRNGNRAIDHLVLDQFRKLTERDVVWERIGRYWRLRKATDEPGRSQDDE